MRWKIQEDNGPRDGDEKMVKRFTFFPYQIDFWSEWIWLETIYVKRRYYNQMEDEYWREGWEDVYLVDKETYKNYKKNGETSN